jgi:basic membrane protein A and related proteins
MFMNGEDGMPYDRMLSRRALLRSAVLTTAGLWAALPVRAANPTVVGFIYVGPRDDFGYNQAHAQGAAAVAKMLGVKVVEEEKVPETVDVQKTMGSMITLDGATLLFPTSFGYFDPHVLKLGFDQVTRLCVAASPLYRPCWDFSGSFSVRRL